MKQCKYCQAELAENGNFCPVCGKNNSEEAAEEIVTAEEAAAPVTEETTVPAEEEIVVPAVEEAVEEQTAHAEIKEGAKTSPAKIAVIVVAVVVLAALLIGLLMGGMGNQAQGDAIDTDPTESASAIDETELVIEATTPADGNPDDETCKGTYTVTDEEVIAAMDTVVATVGEYELTNAELQVYYWLEVQSFLNNYGTYAYYFGLDYTQPLDTQVCGISEGRSWQQFFLSSAIGTWHNYRSMAAEAELADFQLDAETQAYLDTLATDIEESALTYGFTSGKEMLAYNVGAGAEIEDYVNFMKDYYLGYNYYNSLTSEFDTGDAALEAYYRENEAEFTENGITEEDKYVDVRHILIMPEGGTTDENGAITYSDAEWEAAQLKAQEILDQYLAGDKTEDSFASLANEYTADGNDVNYDGIPDGGLYTDVYEGQMVEEFEDWCFDDVRVTGDTGLVKTTYGWHVMYFVDSRPVWKSYAEEQLTMKLANELLAEIIAKYPLTVDYSAVQLGFVDMNA